ncbi:deacetylase [Halomonas cupida]|uniref:Deacetylase n=1 Tax=Halomonas cupida TaxID=44933 RepID=A0A1M7JMR1_9GAMM|nr:histone deacetylase family protein [Halomonas cupida]GEN24553.1 deacetylase [Halomonas cupida]SHM54195.1 Acetoin utilization deacetylase AcuC [Halomonas cupida]
MITAYLTHPAFSLHDMGIEHPESPMRLDAIRARLMRSGLLQQTMQADAREVTDEQLLRVHSAEHFRKLTQLSPDSGFMPLDNDTLLNPDSLGAARLAAGAVVKGVDQVMGGKADNVFCAVRPPGHHAEANQAMGFCLFNNIAVAAAHARAEHGIERIAILDFDVHQCNGTIDIFRQQKEILICTSYQSSFYPWRYLDGDYDNVINTPLSAGSGSADFRHAIEHHWIPALEEFRPQLVLVSAGFDAHREDPLGELCLEDQDFYWITCKALEIAGRHANGRLVSVLEGGYNLAVLGGSVEAHLRALLGQPWPDSQTLP